MDTDHALSSMNTCNYYLRKHLEVSGTGIELTYAASYYTLKLDGALCDADLFRDAVTLSRKSGGCGIRRGLVPRHVF